MAKSTRNRKDTITIILLKLNHSILWYRNNITNLITNCKTLVYSTNNDFEIHDSLTLLT